MRDEGSAVAGSNYVLFCEVTIPPFSDTINVSEPYIEWTLPFGEIQSGVIGKEQLSFSPLTIDDEGIYTCTARYFVNGISSPAASSFYNVFISKYMHMHVRFYMPNFFVRKLKNMQFLGGISLYRSWRSVSECDRLWIRRSWFSLHSHLHSHTPPQS